MRLTIGNDGDAYMQNVATVDHPLVQHKLALLRDKTTSTQAFRQLTRELAALLCYEITRDLALDSVQIETPLVPMQARMLSGKKLVFAPILRAGMGLLDGMLDLVPCARVAHIGLYRDPVTLQAIEYYFKAPADLGDRLVIAVDPMLATGNTAVAAMDRLKAHGANELRFVCLLAAPAGIANLHAHHPEVRIWTAAIDPELNDHGYIVPGLGDAGDRLYGTR
jgi:uracil phosphoribosyltransferase